MSDLVRGILSEQRRRLIATILGTVEASSAWSKMPAAEQKAFREKIIASIGVFADLCFDVLKVTNEGSIRNELAVGLIQQVHDSQRRLERTLAPHPS